MKNATSKEKRDFLRGKGVTDDEISTAFARAGVVREDDREEEEDFNNTNEKAPPRYHPTTRILANDTNRPPAVPYGVIQKHSNVMREGMRWTQMVAYATALCAFGSYVPAREAILGDEQSDDQMKKKKKKRPTTRGEETRADDARYRINHGDLAN